MRLVAMLAWYDESAENLQRCVFDLADLGVTHLVAVDGPYALFPHHGQAQSPKWQRDIIAATCAWKEIDLTLYAPARPWEGNEAEKRDLMMQLALALCESPDDYVFPWDSDFRLFSLPSLDMKRWLEEAGHPDFADLEISEIGQDGTWYGIRQFIRARCGIHFTTNHYTYHFDDGGGDIVVQTQSNVIKAPMSPVRILHKQEERQRGRRQRQVDYYHQRDVVHKGTET
jgi:hypothetical protein